MAGGTQITEQDRREATCVTSREAGHQFEIQLGHLCNNRCVFCSSGQLTQMKIARHVPLDPIVQAIEEARAAGARRITFLGGEPTLHKGFLAALQRTVELGFEEVVIFTNGVLLPHPGFIDKVVALGRFEWRISIQGGNEEAHVAVTGRKDSFRRIVEGLEMLRARGQDVTANMCVNERSYRSLPEFPALLRQHGVRQLHVDIVRPSSTGERTDEYLRDIMPSYSAMAPSMDEMLRRFEREAPEIDVSLGNLPFCILPQWSHRISHGGEQTVTRSSDSVGLEVGVDKYSWHASMRRHVAACEGCAFRSDCTGIFSHYLDIHGEAEFRAVSLADLKGLGAGNYRFKQLVGLVTKAIEAKKIPAGWEIRKVAADHRGRVLTIDLSGSGDARLNLRFASTGPAIEARVALGGDCADADLSRVLAWASGWEGLVAPIDAGAAAAENRRLRLLRRGRERVARLVRRLETHGPFGAWSIGPRRDEAAQSIVEFQGPAGGRIDLVFTIRPEPGQSHVSLDARLGHGTDPAAARATVDELLRTLSADAAS